jgi:hypothetical protein
MNEWNDIGDQLLEDLELLARGIVHFLVMLLLVGEQILTRF